MGFYEELSRVYDIVFKKEDNTVNFLKKSLFEKGKALDLACGTGTYAIELAKEGHNVVGIDLDEKMIEKAKEKSDNMQICFYKEDMRRFQEVAGDAVYNLVYCIGNSLVHLSSKGEVQKFIDDISNSLSKSGTLVIQIINYDRIISKSITSLPTIDRSDEGVRFVRNYRIDDEKQKVYFETELLVKHDDNEESYNNSVELLPLQSNELIEIIEKAGFPKYELYGGFNQSDFTESSYALVVRAYKNKCM